MKILEIKLSLILIITHVVKVLGDEKFFPINAFSTAKCLIEKPKICRAHCLFKVTDNPSFSKQSAFDLESGNAVRGTKFLESIRLFPFP